MFCVLYVAKTTIYKGTKSTCIAEHGKNVSSRKVSKGYQDNDFFKNDVCFLKDVFNSIWNMEPVSYSNPNINLKSIYI